MMSERAMPQDDDDSGAAVTTGRVRRLLQIGSIATGIADGFAAGRLRSLAQGRRPDAAQLLLTPANMLRLTDGLSHLRGAALKLGQMLSLHTRLVLPDELTAIMGRMRGDARDMQLKHVQTVLKAEWSAGWYTRFAQFDVRPLRAIATATLRRVESAPARSLSPTDAKPFEPRKTADP